MPSPAASRTSFRNLWRRFRGNRRGSAAIEFALVAPVFFALLFAIIETALMFFASQVLETVTQNSARMILTGQAQAAGYTQQQFHDQVVCPAGSLALVLFSCSSTGIYIDVESYSSFSNIVITNHIDGSRNFNTTMQYSTGGPGDIVVVQLFYQWPMIVTGLGFNISNLTGSKRLLVATAAFRNEPF
jgi:Flp pilus assembly protein TadG